MDGELVERTEKAFLEKMDSIERCLDRAEEETYDWENVEKELTAIYNSLPQELQDKYKRQYSFQRDAMGMMKGEQK